MPHVVPRPQTVNSWCCDFINKGFCEPEKHGIRMNYFLSCGLARFANLGVFGPSPGNKLKSLSKRHRCSWKGEVARNDAPLSLPQPRPQRSGSVEVRTRTRPAGGQDRSAGLPWASRLSRSPQLGWLSPGAHGVPQAELLTAP